MPDTTELPPIPSDLAAVWGAFLHEGLMLSLLDINHSQKILDTWGQGCIELIREVCGFVDDLWLQVQPFWNQPWGFPGVFEYEVVSALGEDIAVYLLGNDGRLPAGVEAERMVSKLVTRFFAQGL